MSVARNQSNHRWVAALTLRLSGCPSILSGGVAVPYDAEQRGADERKLEALVAISKAIAELGSSLTTMIRHTLDNSRKLDGIDRKLDKLLDLADQPERAKTTA